MMNNSKTDYSDWYSWIEKRVCAKDKFFGTLKYFGNTNFSDGLWCGIELDNPLGKNDGMVNNVRYFTCRSNFGVFVPVSKVCKIKDPSEINSENLSETFKIDNCLKKKKVESNIVISNEWTDKNIDFVEGKLSNSGLGSTESLGILNLDLFDGDNSWDDFKLNCSPSDAQNSSNISKNNTSGLLEPAAESEGKILHSKISYPKYASTPRVPKKKLVNCEIFDDSIEEKHQLVDKFMFEIQCQETSELIFDDDNLQNNQNLTSTLKNFSELTAILDKVELSPILLGNKNNQQFANLEDHTVFSKKETFSQNNEILSKTFEFHDSASSYRKEFEEIFTNKNDLNITTIIEDIRSNKVDATIEIHCPINNSSKLSPEEAKDLTFDLKENETKSFNKSNSLNELNANSFIGNLKDINFNGNATFELRSPIQVQQNMPKETEKNTLHSIENIENISHNFNNLEAMTDVSIKNKLLLEKTFVLDLSTINECDNVENRNESFNYKSEFLKETDIFQNSSSHINYRNSICVPPSFCNKLQKSTRKSYSASSYPSFKPNEEINHKSFYNRGSVSSLKNLHEKANVFKKPLILSLKNSKAVVKSSTNSKENRSKVFDKKEETIFMRNPSFRNTNSKTSIKTECKKSELDFKSKFIKSFNKDDSSNISKIPSVSSTKCSSSKAISNLALPLKNKLNCNNFKQPSSLAPKIYSKTMPVNKIVKNSNSQTATVTTRAHKDSDKDNVIEESFKGKRPVGVIKPRYSMPTVKVLGNREIEKKRSSQTTEVAETNVVEISQSNGERNFSVKECSEVNSNKNFSYKRNFTSLPMKIKNKFLSPSSQKPGLKKPFKRCGIPS